MATTPAIRNTHTDGATEYVSSTGSGSAQSSAASSPPSPAMPMFMDGTNDSVTSGNPSPFLSRSTSPGPVTGSGPEDYYASQFQYGYGIPGGMFGERSHTPQACV